MALLSFSPVVFGQFQLQNSGFEEWEVVSSGEEPISWSSFLEASGSMASMVTAVQLEKSTISHSGTYSAKIYARSVAGIANAQGNITTGRINGGSMTASDGSGNYNWTDESTGHAMRFSGRPDALRVWLKGKTSAAVKISAYLHGKGRFQDPHNFGANAEFVALAAASPAALTDGDWAMYEVPFVYESESEPYYALVSFATCAVAGGGSSRDTMYIDDVEMIYYSELASATFNGSPVVFTDNTASVDADYSPKKLKIVSTGAGAIIEQQFNDTTNLLSITIKADNFEEDSLNVHYYSIQFTGRSLDNDDEPEITIVPETLTSMPAEEGSYYLYNVGTGLFLQNDNTLSDSLHLWTLSENNGFVVTDAENKGLSLTVSRSASSFSASNFSVKSNVAASSATAFVFSKNTDGSYSMYRSLRYYNGLFGLGAKTDNIYFAANGSALTCQLNGRTTNAANWLLIDSLQYVRVNEFWPLYPNARIDNGIDASIFMEKDTVNNLPLGVYSVADSGIVTVNGTAYSTDTLFYVPNGATVSFEGMGTLLYHGRLDLGVHGTYNGVPMENNVCDTFYTPGHDEEYMALTYGNGAFSHEVSAWDPVKCTLEFTVRGMYGRFRESEVAFKKPDFRLYATFIGDSINASLTSGQGNVDEVYDAAHLVITPGEGIASHAVAFCDTTNVLTITLTDIYNNTKVYNLTFKAPAPEVIGGTDYTTNIEYTVADEDLASLGTYARVDSLANGHISFSLKDVYVLNEDSIGLNLGTITAEDLEISEEGRFFFSGERRLSNDLYLGKLPFILSGQIHEGLLYATAKVELNDSVTAVFTSNLIPLYTQNYTDSLLVSVNGSASAPMESTIEVGTLGNGNINFLLKNFTMNGVGAVGNIAISNLEILADSTFTYNGPITISKGDDPEVDMWLGPTMGSMNIDMRGQFKNGGLCVVIDIDLTESLNQMVHVTFGLIPASSVTFVRNIIVTVENDEPVVQDDANIVVGYLTNGNINFLLKDFYLGEIAVGNISIENLELAADGSFRFDDYMTIGAGSEGTMWTGPALGALLLHMTGSLDNTTADTLYVHIDIDLTESLGYNVAVDIESKFYKRVTTVGTYETICLPYAVEADKRAGATFFNVAGTVAENGVLTGVVLEEETGVLEAGKPYIFLATADTLAVSMSGTRTLTAVETTGLVGNPLAQTMAVPEGKMVLSANEIYPAYQGVTIGYFEAYINLDSVAVVDSVAEGNIILPISQSQLPCSVDNLSAGGDTFKYIENGRLYIRRKGNVYDVLGIKQK